MARAENSVPRGPRSWLGPENRSSGPREGRFSPLRTSATSAVNPRATAETQRSAERLKPGGQMVRQPPPNRRGPGNCLERHCHFGDARESSWEATAKTAVTGKIIGNGPPKRRCPEKRLGSRCRNGRWRGSGWEAIAKTVTSGNKVSRKAAKAQRFPEAFRTSRLCAFA